MTPAISTVVAASVTVIARAVPAVWNVPFSRKLPMFAAVPMVTLPARLKVFPRVMLGSEVEMLFAQLIRDPAGMALPEPMTSSPPKISVVPV